jgi:hypothetical protein
LTRDTVVEKLPAIIMVNPAAAVVQMFREVLECASPLALWTGASHCKSGGGPPHSKTLPRLPMSLIIPMSIINNWLHLEVQRFNAPHPRRPPPA